MAAKTLGPSGRGRHIHSTLPLGETSALTSQSERKAYSAMGGKGLSMGHTRCSASDAWDSGAGWISIGAAPSRAPARASACSAATPFCRGFRGILTSRLERAVRYSAVFLLAARKRAGINRQEPSTA